MAKPVKSFSELSLGGIHDVPPSSLPTFKGGARSKNIHKYIPILGGTRTDLSKRPNARPITTILLITSKHNGRRGIPGVNKLETATTTSPQPGFSTPAAMSRPSESQSPVPSPGLQSSRPTTPSPLASSINIHSPHVARRPSSSLSIRSASSRRTSMLSPTDPSLPQRLPRQQNQQDIAAFAELFQELEIEHEAQVNRLLKSMHLHQLQCPQPYSVTDDNSSTVATIDSNSATAGRARSPASTSSLSRRGSGRLSRERSSSRRSHSIASATPYPGGNLILDNSSDTSSGAPCLGPTQPDIAYCVAEARAIKRQADILGIRMKELERQVMELSLKQAPASSDIGSSFS